MAETNLPIGRPPIWEQNVKKIWVQKFATKKKKAAFVVKLLYNKQFETNISSNIRSWKSVAIFQKFSIVVTLGSSYCLLNF